MTGRTEPLLERGIKIGPYRANLPEPRVYLSRIIPATHIETGARVALKRATGPRGEELLENELAMYRRLSLAGVESNYLVRLHGTGVWEDTPFIATYWQLNGTLEEALPRPRKVANHNDVIDSTVDPPPQDLQRNLRIIADGTKGLEDLHRAGIIHCDIKPANVAVGDDYTGRLFDFDVAAPVNDTLWTVQGTLGQSIPPEGYMDGYIASPARDAWAMAATAFRALSGVKPFGESYSWDPLDLHSQINREPDLTLGDFHPNAPPDLDRVIAEALNPDPKKRPPIDEMRDIFDQAASQDGIFER